MKQGSILSPQMFDKFINDLLTKLKSMDTGVRIYDSPSILPSLPQWYVEHHKFIEDV